MSFESDVVIDGIPKTDLKTDSKKTDSKPRAFEAEQGASALVAAQAKRKGADRLKRIKPSPWLRYGIRLFAVVVAIGLWHFASTTQFHFILNFENVPSPLVVGQQFLDMLHTQRFYIDIGVSIERITIAFALAAVSGIFIGVLMGRFWLVEDMVSPYIEILRPIPAVAWIPLAILIMPTEESSIIFITFLGAFYPIVLNTVHGVGQTPAVLIRAARSLGASNRAILFRVILPAALPNITAGLAIGMGVAWFSLLAGEIISGQYGIGYFTWASYTLVQYPKIIIGMLCIGILGTLSTALVRLMTKPFLRWQQESNSRH
ncbi:MAG: ABC transporter permease [Methylovirgula sp.]